MSIKDRIPVSISENRLVLTGVIECHKLRIPPRIMEFIIDTGSPDSYISHRDVYKLQIPINNYTSDDEVDFGGSRYKSVKLPLFKFYLLKEDKTRESAFEFEMNIRALKTTKTSMKKKEIAEALPSILGMDFLTQQKFSLHVIPTEKLAYLQYEG